MRQKIDPSNIIPLFSSRVDHLQRSLDTIHRYIKSEDFNNQASEVQKQLNQLSQQGLMLSACAIELIDIHPSVQPTLNNQANIKKQLTYIDEFVSSVGKIFG